MLPLTRSRNRARFFGIPFSPSVLFEGGTVAGAWYDPSDLSTMFDTSAGTTPVAMPGQGAAVPVGLMLDKSQGLVLGSELVTNGDFSSGTTGWSFQANATGSVVAGELQVVLSTFTLRAAYQDFTTVIGKTYKVTATARSASGQLTVGAYDTLFVAIQTQTQNASGVNQPFSLFFTATATTTRVAVFQSATGSSQTYFADNISVRELPGNHAIAANDSTKRPVLRARVNLLTYSEEFDNGAWTKSNATAANTTATTDPLGGTTADTLTENAATNIHRAFQNAAVAAANVTVTVSISLKANTRTKAVFGVGDNIDFRFYAAIDLSAGTITQSGVAVAAAGASLVSANIVSQGNGWYRVTLTGTVATGQTFYFVSVAISTSDTPGGLPSYAGDGTSGIYIWGADLRPANIGANVPAYQRIADANTYDTSGFPLYLRFDGIDDSMYTPANLNLSGTDKVSVFAGVRKLTAGVQQLVEFSADVNANNGAFSMPSDSGTGTWGTASKGTAASVFLAASATNSYVAPVTTANTGLHDLSLSTDVARLRVNGSQVAASGAGTAGGNFGTYPLYIGSRNNSSLWFNGHLHSLIIAGSAVSAGNISATEQWVAGKTGIQI